MTVTSAGTGDAKEWTTFVLIPGAGADPRVYAATIEALHDLGHEGIAPPLPLDDPEAGGAGQVVQPVDVRPQAEPVAPSPVATVLPWPRWFEPPLFTERPV